jgi:16S rRNA (adenine1518-N6/adenine1519-N6)-dimethyltransferase
MDHKVRAKKHLGQHFLTDRNIARKISDTLSLDTYNSVLEIGPGMGVLTEHLVKRNMDLSVIEIDKESVEYLQQHFTNDEINIINADFLKFDLSEEFRDDQFAIIGNFPYNISSQIVFKALEWRAQIPEFCGMFQKEVAKRICEKEGSKTYGILSVLVQAFYYTEYLFSVPPTVFSPPPKIDSAVIRLKRKENLSLPCDESLFFKVVKTAFQQRRKTLRNSLKSFNLSEKLKEDTIFGLRPEQLSVSQFISLTEKLENDAISTNR